MMDIDWEKALDRYLEASRDYPRAVEKDVYRASGLNGCVRQTVRDRLGLTPSDPTRLRNFQIGTIWHRFMQQEIGLGFVGRAVEFEKEVKLELEEILVTGHIDCWDGETVYDFKTTSCIEKTLSYPTRLAYIYQLSAYYHSVGAKRATLVYIDKRDLKIAQKDVQVFSEEKILEFCRLVSKAESLYKKGVELPRASECLVDCYGCRLENHGI